MGERQSGRHRWQLKEVFYSATGTNATGMLLPSTARLSRGNPFLWTWELNMQVPAIFSQANRLGSTARGEAMMKLEVMMEDA